MKILHVITALRDQALQLAVAQQTEPSTARQVISLIQLKWTEHLKKYIYMLNSPLFWADIETLKIRLNNLNNWPDVIHLHASALEVETVNAAAAAVKATGQLAPVIWHLLPSPEALAVAAFLYPEAGAYDLVSWEKDHLYQDFLDHLENIAGTTTSFPELVPLCVCKAKPHLCFAPIDVIKEGKITQNTKITLQLLDRFYEEVIGV